MGKFRSSLVAEFLPPRNWELTEDLKFNADTLNDSDKSVLNDIPGIKCSKAGMITVPIGYITDLASIPRLCWMFIAPFDVARAAVVHDILYEKINVGFSAGALLKRSPYRRVADKVFKEGMMSSQPNISKWKVYSCYYAVRLFGWMAIKKSAPRG
jgi:hypothetical protein